MRFWYKKYRSVWVYWLARIFLLLVNLLPRKGALALGRLLGNLAFSLSPQNARLAVRNLRAIYQEKRAGETRRLARESFSELGKNGADALRLKGTERIVECEGWERFARAFGKGKGVICITGHFGCWELMPRYVASKGVRIHSVAQTVYDRRIDSLVRRLREKGGVRVIGRRSGLKEAIRVLKNGEVLGLLIDQGSGSDGVVVDFLGKKTKFPRGPVALSLKTGAPIVPAAIFRREDETHLIQVGEEIPLPPASSPGDALIIGTQACAKALEEHVRRRPTQWVWSYARWGAR